MLTAHFNVGNKPEIIHGHQSYLLYYCDQCLDYALEMTLYWAGLLSRCVPPAKWPGGERAVRGACLPGMSGPTHALYALF